MHKAELMALVEKHTGVKHQSENLKQALRYARGALKSTLATDKELKSHIETINRILALGA